MYLYTVHSIIFVKNLDFVKLSDNLPYVIYTSFARIFLPCFEQNEMSLSELENHLIELKSKEMNTRPILRKLLLHYAQNKNLDRFEDVLQVATTIEMIIFLRSKIWSHKTHKRSLIRLHFYASMSFMTQTTQL